ncbi:hypothetical protein [Nonomuraea ceibae]|uniref:hypothetical protein n=1 Tax=Nonomuraea ceibae TaxID=1935170 RepID=UPI001C5F0812|nr:hypothetical protein [Nonomuraea ceibae]
MCVDSNSYARQSRAQWLDAFSMATLKNAAEVTAAWVRKYNIPIRHLTPAQVRAGQKRFCAHWDVTRAYPGTGSHTDPGKGFPWDKFLALVKAEVDGKPAKPATWSRTLVYKKGKPYMQGADVEAWQARLDELGYDVDVDGLHGPGSTAATKKLQAKLKISSPAPWTGPRGGPARRPRQSDRRANGGRLAGTAAITSGLELLLRQAAHDRLDQHDRVVLQRDEHDAAAHDDGDHADRFAHPRAGFVDFLVSLGQDLDGLVGHREAGPLVLAAIDVGGFVRPVGRLRER